MWEPEFAASVCCWEKFGWVRGRCARGWVSCETLRRIEYLRLGCEGRACDRSRFGERDRVDSPNVCIVWPKIAIAKNKISTSWERTRNYVWGIRNSSLCLWEWWKCWWEKWNYVDSLDSLLIDGVISLVKGLFRCYVDNQLSSFSWVCGVRGLEIIN